MTTAVTRIHVRVKTKRKIGISHRFLFLFVSFLSLLLPPRLLQSSISYFSLDRFFHAVVICNVGA